jgi:hypothetical protein
MSALSSKPVQTNTSSTSSLPSWLTDIAKSNTMAASDVAKTPFTAYEGNPYGGTSEDSRTAFQGLRDYISGGGAGGNASIDKYMTTGPQKVATEGTFDAGDIDKYMNPYTEKALAPALRKIQESADAARLRLKSGATSSGSFGDSRHGIVESKLDANTSQAIGDTSSQFLMNAFRDAVSTKTGDINRQLGVDTTNAQLEERGLERGLTGAQAQQAQVLQQLQTLLGFGGAQEAKDEKAKLFDYEQFREGRDWEKNNLSWRTSLLAGTPADRTTTGTQTQEGGPSPWMYLLGGLAQGVGSKI